MSMVVCSVMFAFSIILEIANNLILIKKLADKGCRYDKSKIFHFKVLLLTFIPIVNIIFVIGRGFLLNSIDSPFVAKNIIPMTKVEKQLYNSNPSIETVIKLNKNIKLSPNMVLVYTEKNQENIIYFMDDEEKYIITSVKGPISEKSRKSQYQALKRQLNEINSVIDSNNRISNEVSQKEKLFIFNNDINIQQEYINEIHKVYTKNYSK